MEETILSGRLPEQNIVADFPTSRLKKEKTLEFIVYFFILLFTYAGLRKLIDLEMFVKEVWGFAIFGSKLAVKIEFICLSVAELIVATLLVIPRTRTFGWYATFVLVIAINIFMFIMQQYAKVIPLYYGGIIPGISFIAHFAFNIAILFIALIGLLKFLDSKKQKQFT